jgi:hypothetical protein
VHIEGLEQQVRLVAHALSQTLVFRAVEVVLQDGFVVGVSALVDNDSGPLAGRKTTDVCETLDTCQQNARSPKVETDQSYLLSNYDVQVMLRLIDVRAHRHDAAHTLRIGLARPGAWRMHDAVFGTSQKVRTTAQSVQHPAAHHASAVGVCVDVDFDGRVHADDAEAADNFGRVGDLL